MWHAFGDESSFPNGLTTYAIVGVWSKNQKVTEDAFRQLRLSFGGKSNSRIHCRELFGIHARAKSDWAHLSDRDVGEFLLSLAKLADQFKLRRSVGFVDGSRAPMSLPGIGSIESRCELNEKHLCTLAFVAAAAQVFQQLGPNRVKYWVDLDKTKIDWWGQKRQADLTRTLTLMDFDFAKVTPELDKPNDRIFLDLADILAYSAGRAQSTTEPDRAVPFKELMNIWAPGTAEYDLWASED